MSEGKDAGVVVLLATPTMTARFLVGDVFDRLATLEDDSVDLVLTSPPFLALRSYLPADHPDKHLEGGSQATPGEFIDWLVDVVEALDRVLAPHGSLVVELGDTYAGSGGAGGDYNADGLREGQPKFRQDNRDGWPLPKSLSLIPEIFRFTLVYGFNPLTQRTTPQWRDRNNITWCRPNPPVGALGDKFRPGTSDLMVFCKSAKRFFDLDAVREPHKYAEAGLRRNGPGGMPLDDAGRPAADGSQHLDGNAAGAPPLDWWQIPTHPYKGSHYATFPPALCVRPIKAMCPERVCLVCGEPSRRITGEPEYVKPDGRQHGFHGDGWETNEAGANRRIVTGVDNGNMTRVAPTLGWSDCGHDTWRPGHVLDPFAGTGTVLAVATGHGRNATGIDLDERNADLALERVGPLMLTVEP